MAVHGSDEAKPLSCVVCGKRFLSNSALACHVKVHSDVSNVYDCPICSATFDQVSFFFKLNRCKCHYKLLRTGTILITFY